MDGIYLTVKEVAELKGCEERSVRRLIERQSLSAETVEVKGAGQQRGIQYRIPLTELDSKLQVKYKRRQHDAVKAAKAAAVYDSEETTAIAARGVNAILGEPPAFNFESISAAERGQITFWKSLLNSWDSFRAASDGRSKAETDELFIQYITAQWEKNPPAIDVPVTVRNLYRKRKALYSVGEAGLIDRRGKHGNHSRKMTDEMRNVFEYYYLDRTRKSTSLCVFLTGEELARRNGEAPGMPSIDTFERHANKIPVPYVKWFREGEEAFLSDCAPYIRRMYDGLEPNDIWVADGHTFDVMIQGKDGKPVRMYLSAFMDVRTRKMMGWVVTDKLCGDATIYALKKGVEKYGAPKMIYTDNGREYLFQGFSGDAGFRKKAKKRDGEFVPPTILENLGIEMITAIPKNARAKGIERAFETLKETFSKLFDSYTGGNVLEKPDDLKQVLKQPDKLFTIEEFTAFVEAYITGYYNKQPHRGEGMNGNPPDEVYAELYYEKRVVPADKLNLMFMRYGKGTMKVGKNGVTLRVYGAELQYSSPELWEKHFGREVYVRYSPDDLGLVRVYDTDNRFLCEAPQDKAVPFIANKDELQEARRAKQSRVKAVKNYKNTKKTEAQSALDAMINKCLENNSDSPESLSPKVIRVIQSGEPLPLPKAAGAETECIEPLNWSEAVQKLKESRGVYHAG